MAKRNKRKRDDTEDNDEHNKFPKKTEQCKVSPGNNDKKYKCEQCEKSYKDRHSLDRHVTAKHNSKESNDEHKCDLCDSSYEDKCSLDRHVKAKHNLKGSNDEHKCELCEKSFKYKFELNRHIRTLHKKCDFCEYVTTRAVSYTHLTLPTKA